MIDSKILLLMPDLPFPVRKNGFSIRYFPIIEHLSLNHELTIAVISDHEIDQSHIQEAEAYARRVLVHVRKPSKVDPTRKVLALIRSLHPRSVPLHYFRYDQDTLINFMEASLGGQEFDTLLCVKLNYLDLARKYTNHKRLVLDLIDSDALYQNRLSGKSFIGKLRALEIRRWERRAINTVNHAIYISKLDLQYGTGEPSETAKTSIIPNGIYEQDQSSEKAIFHGPTIGFLGHMSYPPNIGAALRLARLFEMIRDACPEAQLVIIGRSPVAAIRALAGQPGITVTGTVESIWPYLNGVDIFAFPMESGTGQQNKLLEAMYAGKPVVSTALGNQGIGGVDRQHLLLAETDDALVNTLTDLLQDSVLRDRLGKNGQAFVKGTYSWPAILKKFEDRAIKPK